MTDHEVLHLRELLGEGGKRVVTAQEVWLVHESIGQTAMMALASEESPVSWEMPAGWQGLLMLDRVEVQIQAGQLTLRVLKLEVLSKLLAFLDEAQNLKEVDTRVCAWAALPLEDPSVCEDRKRCEYWFLSQALTPTPAFSEFLSGLRRSESYWLVRFLLAQSAGCSTLQDLGERYGVSYSHFRRLCRHALGSAAKTELRDWRMARSLLDVVEGRENLTQVALKHGFASSSHFSNEIRELLGVSPRGLSNIIQLAIK
ncbi:AraC family transcriptional regulator InvF [Chromobacterium amazonense]|uniref:AraC family transcriptional regulator InvF n=1 Tax=Chromobacterium amazonense TaxID=1382803 RepID=UPI00237E5DAF|nr:AraC family transcriptional regulator InvF [Chromobacterium amazonense]MDE1715439.1 AraC family transcriptional regulator InvF [Chromobacterium amazonense]